eukprot:m.227187 g.227187  ORF g.227187 m.227187 type:complete len:806 (-) comp17143_c0_seq1:162-2579(-)
MPPRFTEEEVSKWDVESVAGWLKLLRLDDVVETFRDNDISGVVLLELDDELLEEMEIEPAKRKVILTAVDDLKKNEGGAAAETDVNTANSSDEDDDDDHADSKASSEAPGPAKKESFFKSSKKATVVEKTKDPLRLAARTRAVADLASCTVMSGYLWKIGGSGLKPKHWQRRFFVLTDDNCLYYFKSPKDLSALGIILLPSYTITVCEKAENPGSRPHAFKAYNREQEGARKYILAAEDERDMKTWMNVLSLASIAFGSGKASMAKPTTAPPRLADDHDKDLELMQKRAADRAGGVAGSGDAVVPQARSGPSLSSGAKLNKNHAPCHIKMLDGRIMKLFAEPSTTGQQFIDQICDTLKLHEKYYFGLKYVDPKGDEDWIKPEKKILKHLFPRGDHINLEFSVQFYPMDVTQVMQYVTLYQCFLAARQSVLTEELDVSNKDAFLLASLYLQAIYGDYDAAVHTPALLAKETLIPERNKADIMKEAQIKPADLELFWVEEVVRTWVSLKGILRHLTVLKYIQVIQKHRRFAMQYFHVKNSQGTPLVLGVNPHGLFLFRNEQLHRPVATFSWAECSELSFTEKKFSIQVHDKETKAFSVTCSRSKICQRILNLCIGLHRLYVLTIRQWADAPADMLGQRKQAIEAAIIEREELKKEAAEVRRKAKELKKKEPVSAAAAAAAARTQPRGPAPTAAAPVAGAAATPGGARGGASQLTAATGEVVYIKGRDEAVRLMDMMMADEDFMRYQEELFQGAEDSMAAEIEKGGRLRSQSFMGKKGMRLQDEQNDGELDHTPVAQRAERLSQMGSH